MYFLCKILNSWKPLYTFDFFNKGNMCGLNEIPNYHFCFRLTRISHYTCFCILKKTTYVRRFCIGLSFSNVLTTLLEWSFTVFLICRCWWIDKRDSKSLWKVALSLESLKLSLLYRGLIIFVALRKLRQNRTTIN